MDELFIGLMSGTSLDGVDGVLVHFSVSGNEAKILGHSYRAFSAEFARELFELNTPGHNELHRAALASNALAQAYAQTVEALLKSAGCRRDQVLAVGAHGQTVRHRPGEFDGVGYTLQLNAPALLAELIGIDVVADFRSRDVAAGGQGAPLVPAFHRAVFGRPDEIIGVLNLGGISNLTILGAADAVIGFDCGPGNALMDHWCQLHTGRPFDKGGTWAASGRTDPALLATMLAEPYFGHRPPKSTGRDLFNPEWLAQRLRAAPSLSSLQPEDVQATLAELTARVCADSVLLHAPGMSELLVCGGGTFNAQVMTRLADTLPGVRVISTDERGLPAMHVEACAFAWLARSMMRRTCGNLVEVTGARGARVLGALYPAH